MSKTLTIRLPADLAQWLAETSRRTGLRAGRIIRDRLEQARRAQGERRFMRHAGALPGSKSLSSRSGFEKA